MSVASLVWPPTVSIRIVADCVELSCHIIRKLKRDKALEFTTISAIIFIHCYAAIFFKSSPGMIEIYLPQYPYSSFLFLP